MSAPGGEMHLSLRLNLYRSATLEVPVDLVKAADELGYHSVWSAERTGPTRCRLSPTWRRSRTGSSWGTAIAQLAARPPGHSGHACHDHRRAGRRGTGHHRDRSLGPQIVEGLVRATVGNTPRPRLRDYLAIMRKVLDRKEPVAYEGTEISPAVPGARIERAGEGPALHTPRRPPPSRCGWRRGARRTPSLCGEVADGWLPMGFGSEGDLAPLERGWKARGGRPADFRDLHRFLGPGSLTMSRGPWTACAR